jgi:hypothetical protein
MPKPSDFEQFVNQYGPELGPRRQLATRPGSVGSTAARLHRGRPRVWVFGRARHFCLLQTVLMGCRSHLLFSGYRRVKLPRRGLDHLPHLVPRLRMSGAVPPRPVYVPSWCGKDHLYLYLTHVKEVCRVGHEIFRWTLKWILNCCIEIWYFWKFCSCRINLFSV